MWHHYECHSRSDHGCLCLCCPEPGRDTEPNTLLVVAVVVSLRLLTDFEALIHCRNIFLVSRDSLGKRNERPAEFDLRVRTTHRLCRARPARCGGADCCGGGDGGSWSDAAGPVVVAVGVVVDGVLADVVDVAGAVVALCEAPSETVGAVAAAGIKTFVVVFVVHIDHGIIVAGAVVADSVVDTGAAAIRGVDVTVVVAF